METVIASLSGGSGFGSGCSDGPWIVNPDFDDPIWPGAWLPSNSVHRSSPGFTGLWLAELPVGAAAEGDSQLVQAIIIPSGRAFTVGFNYLSRNVASWSTTLSVTFSLGSYTSQPITFFGASYWNYQVVTLGPVNDPSECFPVVFSIKASIVSEVLPDVPKSIQIDGLRFISN